MQVIGLDSNFDFDVSVQNPLWMDANEDGVLSVHSRKCRTPVQRPMDPEAERLKAIAEMQQSMQLMEEMGFCSRYGEKLVRFMLLRYENDMEKAIADLSALV
jgi:hypothetical protein